MEPKFYVGDEVEFEDGRRGIVVERDLMFYVIKLYDDRERKTLINIDCGNRILSLIDEDFRDKINDRLGATI